MTLRFATTVAISACLALSPTACDVVFVDPQVGPTLEARFALQPPAGAPPASGDFADVLSHVRLVYLSLERDGQARDTVVPGVVEDGGVRALVRLRPEEAFGWVTLRTDLRADPLRVLFRGQGALRVDGLVARATFDLVPVADEIDVGPNARTLDAVGDTATLAATAYFATGEALAGAVFAWTSSNPSVVEVLPDGRAISRSNGAATITAMALGGSGAADFVVRQTVTSFSGVAPADTTLSVGGTLRMRPIGLDPNGSPLLPGANVTWSSTGGLTVDADGMVQASAAGAAYVHGTVAGTVYTVPVTIVP